MKIYKQLGTSCPKCGSKNVNIGHCSINCIGHHLCKDCGHSYEAGGETDVVEEIKDVVLTISTHLTQIPDRIIVQRLGKDGKIKESAEFTPCRIVRRTK